MNSYISHNEFASVNVLKEDDDLKEAVKISKMSTVHQRF